MVVALIRGVSATTAPYAPPDLVSPPNVVVSTAVPQPSTPPHVVTQHVTVTATVTTSVAPGLAAPSPTAASIRPVAIRIPAIAVSSRDVVAVGRNPDKSMQVPPLNKVGELGWDKYSPVPGTTGPSVVLAHDEQQGHHGLFWNLGKLQAGDAVELDRSDGQTATFRVTQAVTIPKANWDQIYPSIYDPTSDPQLRLISCSGLTSQEVVFANLVSLRPTVTSGGH